MNFQNNLRARQYSRSIKSGFGGAPVLFKVFFGIVATIILAGFVVVGANLAINANTVNTYTACEVTRTEVSVISSGDSTTSQKRVYTSNCGVFTADDNIMHGVWNSADIYGSIQEGNTYDFTASGIRLPILSWFPNIITVTESI